MTNYELIRIALRSKIVSLLERKAEETNKEKRLKFDEKIEKTYKELKEINELIARSY